MMTAMVLQRIGAALLIALLRMKVERSGEPLKRFKDIAFGTVFGPQAQ